MNCLRKSIENKNDKNKKENKTNRKRAAAWIFAVLLTFCAAGLMIVFAMMWTVDDDPVFVSDTEMADLELWRTAENVDFSNLTDGQYDFLLSQTGLGRSAVDSLNGLSEDEIFNEIKQAQQNFYNSPEYTCDKIGLFSENERFRDEYGEKINYYELVDLKKGDVLISMSTHTMGYRHGHCGLVVKEATEKKKAKTLEAVYWGKPTEICSASRWCSCPTLLHLRVSEECAEKLGYTQEELGDEIAEFALENCDDINYSLIPQLFNLKAETINKTHCSHLIWYVYNEFGVDTDSDGGYLVTPWDIASSDCFEIVQAYGIDLESL